MWQIMKELIKERAYWNIILDLKHQTSLTPFRKLSLGKLSSWLFGEKNLRVYKELKEW